MNFKIPSFNKVFIAGNLLSDPESKVTLSKAVVTNFKIASNKRFRDSQGIKDKVCYVNIVTWSKLGEICAKILKKGDGVFVEGELQNRQIQEISILEVLANKVEFLTKRNYVDSENDAFEEISNDLETHE